MADKLKCVNPECREDLLTRMVTKKMAWLFIVLIAPVTFTSLGIGFKVWGQSEFYLVGATRAAAFRIEAIDTKVTRIETQLGHLTGRLDEQLQRIKRVELDAASDRTEIINILKSTREYLDRNKRP